MKKKHLPLLLLLLMLPGQLLPFSFYVTILLFTEYSFDNLKINLMCDNKKQAFQQIGYPSLWQVVDFVNPRGMVENLYLINVH